jgi:lysophospholipase L1-like esterase
MRHVAVLLSIAGLVLPPAASAAQRERPVTRGSIYLALGDSVSFGYRPEGAVPAPDYTRPSSFRGWPELAARALRLRLVNASCPGETSASLIDRDATSFGCENAAGNPNLSYRRSYPLHARYSGSQLSFALRFLRSHPRTRLVTLMVGANDLFLCRSTTADACLDPAERQAVIRKVALNARRIVSRIRHRAGYRGQIVLMKYYSPDYDNAFLTGVTRTLNVAEFDSTKAFRVRFADGFGEWRAASREAGNDPCRAGLLIQLSSSARCDAHPSRAGQGLLALALTRALRFPPR